MLGRALHLPGIRFRGARVRLGITRASYVGLPRVLFWKGELPMDVVIKKTFVRIREARGSPWRSILRLIRSVIRSLGLLWPRKEIVTEAKEEKGPKRR